MIRGDRCEEQENGIIIGCSDLRLSAGGGEIFLQKFLYDADG